MSGDIAIESAKTLSIAILKENNLRLFFCIKPIYYINRWRCMMIKDEGQLIEELFNQEVCSYITEFGFPTPPPRSKSEMVGYVQNYELNISVALSKWDDLLKDQTELATRCRSIKGLVLQTILNEVSTKTKYNVVWLIKNLLVDLDNTYGHLLENNV